MVAGIRKLVRIDLLALLVVYGTLSYLQGYLVWYLPLVVGRSSPTLVGVCFSVAQVASILLLFPLSQLLTEKSRGCLIAAAVGYAASVTALFTHSIGVYAACYALTLVCYGVVSYSVFTLAAIIVGEELVGRASSILMSAGLAGAAAGSYTLNVVGVESPYAMFILMLLIASALAASASINVKRGERGREGSVNLLEGLKSFLKPGPVIAVLALAIGCCSALAPLVPLFLEEAVGLPQHALALIYSYLYLVQLVLQLASEYIVDRVDPSS